MGQRMGVEHPYVRMRKEDRTMKRKVTTFTLIAGCALATADQNDVPESIVSQQDAIEAYYVQSAMSIDSNNPAKANSHIQELNNTIFKLMLAKIKHQEIADNPSSLPVARIRVPDATGSLLVNSKGKVIGKGIPAAGDPDGIWGTKMARVYFEGESSSYDFEYEGSMSAVMNETAYHSADCTGTPYIDASIPNNVTVASRNRFYIADTSEYSTFSARSTWNLSGCWPYDTAEYDYYMGRLTDIKGPFHLEQRE
jgi:hypothetical protein